MKIAILGRGGREHALARRLARDVGLANIVVLPGNVGIEGATLDLPRGAALQARLRALATELVIVGPEALLAEGIADELRGAGFAVVGPSKSATQLESSKAYAKEFLIRHGIPTARAVVVSGCADDTKLDVFGGSAVVKLDGLAEGKGVVVCSTQDEVARALVELRALHGEHAPIVVEERLWGPELSVMLLVANGQYVVLPEARDHKRLADGDSGPNTGGMGAFSPVFEAQDPLHAHIRTSILDKIVAGLSVDQVQYLGFLYVGLMLTPVGPKVLEFNVRFGDPEAEAVLPRIAGNFADLCMQCARGELVTAIAAQHPQHSVAVVLARRGYPGGPLGAAVRVKADLTAHATTHIDVAAAEFAGDALSLVRGRSLVVVGNGPTRQAARTAAYARVQTLADDDLVWRRDIGAPAPKRLAIFASGRGSNLRALYAAMCGGGMLHGIAQIAVLVSDKPECGAVEFARSSRIPVIAFEKGHLSRAAWDAQVLEQLRSFDIELVALAGFMRILSSLFVRHYSGRIVNVHPADTRVHRGLGGYEDAFSRGALVTRITVHLVDEGLDTGPILAQRDVDLRGATTLAEVETRGLAVEHVLYPRAIRDLLVGTLFQESI
jgi:phosphoribosylamine---glycine ligase